MMTVKPQKTTRVAVASDQAIYLRGLASLMISLPAITLIGEAKNSADALQLCQLSEPDLILLDFNDSSENIHNVAAQIRQNWPHIKIILLFDNLEECCPPDEAGPDNFYYLCRDISEEEFIDAFEQIEKLSGSGGDDVSLYRRERNAAGGVVEVFPPSERITKQEIISRELSMAGKIQADILPEKVPCYPGWDMSVKLEPARETSGDFYDFIPITDHKCAIVVADVADKGMGAALFMALSSTLIRTYASRFPTLPAFVLSTVSDRILSDTHGSMFVTAFFGILEPHTGRLIYANAGHPPAYLIGAQRGKVAVENLKPTGMALGVTDHAQWHQKVTRLNPGDYVLLYTDGITEAQNHRGELFGEDRLLDVALSKVGSPAADMQEALLAEVHRFVGSTPRQDDIALIVIHRED